MTMSGVESGSDYLILSAHCACVQISLHFVRACAGCVVRPHTHHAKCAYIPRRKPHGRIGRVRAGTPTRAAVSVGMPHSRWKRYTHGVRVTFALQYFLNDAALRHAGQYASCAIALGVQWHLIVHEDDGDSGHVTAWQRTLAPLGRNATLVMSQNVHELRGYNMAAGMRDADIVVFLQDDEQPPTDCAWLERILVAFGRDTHLGAVGLRRGATNGDWDDEIKRHGRPALGQSKLCHALLQTPARFVLAVDLAPLAVRRSAFLEVGGFPTFLTPPGTAGIGMDTLLSLMLWRAGWSVLLMPHNFGRVVVRSEGASTRSNTFSTKSVAQYVRTARYIKASYLYNASDPWKNRTLRRVHQLNRQRLEPCAA